MTYFNLLFADSIPVGSIIVCAILGVLMIAIIICGFVFSSDSRKPKKEKQPKKSDFYKKASPKKPAAPRNKPLQNPKKAEKPVAEKTAPVKTDGEKVSETKVAVTDNAEPQRVVDEEPRVAEADVAASEAQSNKEGIITGKTVMGRELSPAARKVSNVESAEYDEVLFQVRYKYSFSAKLALSEQFVKDAYMQIAENLLSYKKVKIRTGKRQCRVKFGKDVLALIVFKGKKLCVAFNLDPSEYEQTKYRGKDMSAKRRFAKTPMLMRVSSPRKLRYVQYLIDELANKNGLQKAKKPAAVYPISDCDTERLIETGEIAVKVKRAE